MTLAVAVTHRTTLPLYYDTYTHTHPKCISCSYTEWLFYRGPCKILENTRELDFCLLLIKYWLLIIEILRVQVCTYVFNAYQERKLI